MTEATDIVGRLLAYEGEPWETTACYNGTREEAADEIERLRAEVERLRELVARIPRALNDAFAAGAEEKEGGSIRRQAKALESVEALRTDARAALEAQDQTP